MTTSRLRQELYAIAESFLGCVFLGLVLAGIGGSIYKTIAPDGWIAHAFGRSLSAGAAAVGSAALIFGLAWFSRTWGDVGRRTLAADFLVYGFAFAGFVYLARLWMSGTF